MYHECSQCSRSCPSIHVLEDPLLLLADLDFIAEIAPVEHRAVLLHAQERLHAIFRSAFILLARRSDVHCWHAAALFVAFSAWSGSRVSAPVEKYFAF